MSDWLMKRIRDEASRLLELAKDDAELRDDLRELARDILAQTEFANPVAEPAGEPMATVVSPWAWSIGELRPKPARKPFGEFLNRQSHCSS